MTPGSGEGPGAESGSGMTVVDEGPGRDTADFGFERVALSEKQGRVDSVFHSVARPMT